MGRTVAKFGRAYIDGIDVSGNTRSFGPLVHEYEEAVGTAIDDEIVGVLPNQAIIAAGTLTGNFDNTVAPTPRATSPDTGAEDGSITPEVNKPPKLPSLFVSAS